MAGKNLKISKIIYFVVFSVVCGLWTADCFAEETAQEYYNRALARQEEINSWKSAKNWEGLYDKAPAYKVEIAGDIKKAESLVKDDPLLLLNIKYLKWESTREDDPDSSIGSFNDLVNTARDVIKGPAAIARLKAIADEVAKLQDKNLARRLYEVYANKLSGSDFSKEELKAQAQKFLGEGNAYLAKTLFGAYLEKLSADKELLAQETVFVADQFADNGIREALDPVYAEEMYKKAYGLSGATAFTSSSQYRRAFNLERMKDYIAAIGAYENLASGYPDYAPKQDVYFRLGALSAYGAKNIDEAQKYFLKVKDEFPKSISALSSLYQLGLLAQVAKDFQKAKEYYGAVAAAAESQGPKVNELAMLAGERLKEIEEQKDLKYGLKLFMEGIFKTFPLSVDLTARPCVQPQGQPIKFIVTTSYPQTGCMTPVYSYEWSGEMGNITNIPNAPEMVTDYAEAGVKLVHVAVIGPQGLDGVGFEIVEIGETK